MTVRRGLVLGLALACAGCAAVQTFTSESGDLASGRTQQRVDDARQRQDAAAAENASLRTDLYRLHQQQAALNGRLASAGAQLKAVKAKLAAEQGATADQRATYDQLAAKRDALQRRAAAVQAAPSQDEAATQAQQAELGRLSAEQAALGKQIDALQRSL